MVADVRRLRCVVDTNVVVSALLLDGSLPNRALVHVRSHGVILMSEATIEELTDVLNREKFDRYLVAIERASLVQSVVEAAVLVSIVRQVRMCRDPRDDKFLEVAVNGAATHIVSGDKDLLALDPVEGVRIVTPAAFLAIVQSR